MRPYTNTLLWSVFFAFSLGFSTYYNYADGQTLTVFTENPTYDIGETVVVSGTIQKATANLPIVIELLDPNGTLHTLDETVRVENGTYTVQFQLADKLTTLGKWAIKASHAGEEATNYFEVLPIQAGVRTQPIIKIVSVSPREPELGDIVIVEGNVTHELETDTVRVEWGDGTSPTSGIGISQGKWGPVSHNYTVVGEYQLRAVLYGSLGAVRDDLVPSEPYTVNVREDSEDEDDNGGVEQEMTLKPEITIDDVSPNNPLCEVPINIRGAVKYPDPAHRVVVDWGDGTDKTESVLSDGKWGPVSHNYTRSGEHQIVAALDKGMSAAYNYDDESEPKTVNVFCPTNWDGLLVPVIIASLAAGGAVTVKKMHSRKHKQDVPKGDSSQKSKV